MALLGVRKTLQRRFLDLTTDSHSFAKGMQDLAEAFSLSYKGFAERGLADSTIISLPLQDRSVRSCQELLTTVSCGRGAHSMSQLRLRRAFNEVAAAEARIE